jgi:hypothetical protein
LEVQLTEVQSMAQSLWLLQSVVELEEELLLLEQVSLVAVLEKP